jgi:hypothetical protein
MCRSSRSRSARPDLDRLAQFLSDIPGRAEAHFRRRRYPDVDRGGSAECILQQDQQRTGRSRHVVGSPGRRAYLSTQELPRSLCHIIAPSPWRRNDRRCGADRRCPASDAGPENPAGWAHWAKSAVRGRPHPTAATALASPNRTIKIISRIELKPGLIGQEFEDSSRARRIEPRGAR